MRVVALEEHFSVPALVKRIDPGAISRRGYKPRKAPAGRPNPLENLPEIGEKRLKSMDDAGITVRVLSNTGPGPDLVPGPDGVAIAREMNDHLAAAVARHPKRFAGFAALPMQSPDACAAELVRAVKELGFVGALINGTTEGRFLDHPSYDGLLAAAVELDVPIYIHPHLPPEPVRQAYYSDLQPGATRVLESAAWGWHSEIAIHVLRMVLAGTLDKHPKLKLIIGHMGEMLPVMLARIDEVSALDIEHLKRPISRAILDQVWITTSGIFSQPPFIAALQTFGIDRIMFSVDYPYAPDAKGREFLERGLARSGRHGEAHPSQRRCAVEAEGVSMIAVRALALIVGLALTASTLAQAQDYPTHPVTIVVPTGPGGGMEMVARLLAPKLEQRLGKPFVIENRPGAGTNIGAAAVARSAPDGYTLLMATSSTMAINASIYKTLPFDPLKDLMPVVLYARVPFVLVVNPSSPAQDRRPISSGSPRKSPAR